MGKVLGLKAGKDVLALAASFSGCAKSLQIIRGLMKCCIISSSLINTIKHQINIT
jgi:hypothetical protein